jgi:ABC transport permease subunit
VKGYFSLSGSILYWTFVAPLRGQPFRLSLVFHQMILIGVRAVPMAALTSFSIGLTLAMQSARELQKMGAQGFVPDLVSVSLLRELGPLLIAVIVIGRSGSAVTAELGTMKVSEEIEALQVMAINPVRFLIVPRVIAMMIMLPVLTIFGNYVGMVGGWSICHYALDFSTAYYIVRSLSAASAWDLYSGLDQERRLRLAGHHDRLPHRDARSGRRGRSGAGDHAIRGLVAAHHADRQRRADRDLLFRRMTTAPEPGEAVIQVRDLVREFGGRRVLDGLSFDVHKGDTMIVMGGSGCGKSTLLRHIIGSMKPSSGSIKIFGEEITRMDERQFASLRRRFGVLFQSGALLQSLTVGENVALPIVEHGKLAPDIIDLMVKMKLELVGLTGFENLKPAEISGGMKKRVGLARALALDPELLFSDEPTAGLDPIMTSVVDILTQDLTRKLGMTALVVTHDMTSAFRIGTRMIMLGTGPSQGKIIASGTPDEIRSHPNPEVQQFINGEADGPVPLKLSKDDYLASLLELPAR